MDPAPRKILIRAPNWIGDHVMARDLYLGIRAAFPYAEITLACAAGMDELARGWGIDRFEIWPAKHAPQWRFWWRLGKQRFDLAISLASSLRSALQLWCTRAARRVGYADRGARIFLTDSRPWRGRASGKHKAALYREILSWVAPRSAAQTRLRVRANPQGDIILAPGASIALRQWPGFSELIALLRKTFPHKTIKIVGGADQGAWEARVASLADDRIESWIGLTTLGELVELCAEASVVVANDSGVAHIAASAAGVPTVVIFGPGDPGYIQPEGQVAGVTPRGIPCAPCESARCKSPLGYQACLRSISAARVLDQIVSLTPA